MDQEVQADGNGEVTNSSGKEEANDGAKEKGDEDNVKTFFQKSMGTFINRDKSEGKLLSKVSVTAA